ncbi:MAG: RidA family protein [Cytophagales bacterium]|jgi:enamine deaminase RidA (YjgF/YER057c/UK114 family)|nr:RidA family protein [Cytophagales bacterium]
MKHIILNLLLLAAGSCAFGQTVEFYGSPTSSISSGAIVPANKKLLWTSGVTAGIADSTAKEGTPARYGDTKTQALDILKSFEKVLKARGLGFKDVLMLRIYITPDHFKDNKPDYQGWFDAYAKYFGTKENPVKPTRSTLGIASLVHPDKFIEIEMVAVFP